MILDEDIYIHLILTVEYGGTILILQKYVQGRTNK